MSPSSNIVIYTTVLGQDRLIWLHNVRQFSHIQPYWLYKWRSKRYLPKRSSCFFLPLNVSCSGQLNLPTHCRPPSRHDVVYYTSRKVISDTPLPLASPWLTQRNASFITPMYAHFDSFPSLLYCERVHFLTSFIFPVSVRELYCYFLFFLNGTLEHVKSAIEQRIRTSLTWDVTHCERASRGGTWPGLCSAA